MEASNYSKSRYGVAANSVQEQKQTGSSLSYAGEESRTCLGRVGCWGGKISCFCPMVKLVCDNHGNPT